MRNLYFLFLLFTCIANAQIGINTTTPNAALDVQSTNNGLLIPRVQLLDIYDTGTVTNPTGAGLITSTMVYNLGPSGIAPNNVVAGFYYWNMATLSWIPIAGNPTNDHDWYKVGTTTAPTAITDDMFHTGNVSIGTTTANFPLTVSGTNNDAGIANSFTTNVTTSFFKTAMLNSVSSTSNDAIIGLSNDIQNFGNGISWGISNAIHNTGNGLAIGNENFIEGTGTGNKIGSYNSIQGNGFAKFGLRNIISSDISSTTAEQKGVVNTLTNTNNTILSTSIGVENTINTVSLSGPSIGIYNTISSGATAGTGGNYGQLNVIGGYKVGGKIGVRNIITSDVSDGLIGFSNTITSTSNGGSLIGLDNNLTSNSNTQTIGNQNTINGTGNNNVFGMYSLISNSGNGNHFGIFSNIFGTGTGTKYGTSTIIETTAGGQHYGVFARVLKPGNNYAGYFNGKVAIGTNVSIGIDDYILPISRGTNGQVMQTDGVGNVTWQNPNAFAWGLNGNTGITDPAVPVTYGTSVIGATENFIGTTDANDLVMGTTNIERIRVKNTTGNVGVGTANPLQPLHVRKDANANKSVILGEAFQTSTALDYQNKGVEGYGSGTAAGGGFGYGVGVLGIGDAANSFHATGVIAHLGTISPIAPLTNQALYANGNNFGNSGVFIGGNVGVGAFSSNASGILEITSTTKGLLLPRMTRAQRNAIVTPVAGLMIYQTDLTPGLRVYNGTNWMRYTETID
jgi:trimeric autotransporter adhesin